MQRMPYRFKRRRPLVKQVRKPFEVSRGKYAHLLPKSVRLAEYFIVKRYKATFSKTQKLAQISGLTLLSLPAQSFMPSFNTSSNEHVYDSVMADKVLIVASVAGDSTFFATDGFQHGFGYDLTRAYANELGVTIMLKAYSSDDEALAAVNKGNADIALTTASLAQTEERDLTALNLSCGYDDPVTKSGLNSRTSWSFKSATDPLAIEASHFLCDGEQIKDTARLSNFYDQNLLKDAYNSQHFVTTLNDKLPDYKTSFQEQADNYDHDWQLLVAMGYQESHLDANAISPTGVKGIMMLTNSTAEAMGVSNRVDPYQSIGGGARYLEEMKETFKDVPEPDRLWFALASYNMGPNAIKRIQNEVALIGKNPNSWANVYSYLSDNASDNSRYVQCMHYVKNIRTYLESIKTQTINV